MPRTINLSSTSGPAHNPGSPAAGDVGKLITSDGTTGELRKPLKDGSTARPPRPSTGHGHAFGR